MKYMGLPLELEQVKKGLAALCVVIKDLRDFHLRLKKQAPEHPFLKAFSGTAIIFEDLRVTRILQKKATGNILEIAGYDHLLRNVLANDIKALFQIAYQLDVYLSVTAVGKERKWTYAQALPANAQQIRLVDFHHPAIQNGITNSLTAGHDQPLIFLTGANMAGKSTLMKAYGIAVYLAHMGFPVAAKEMVFSVKDGMYTSINVPDNLKEGYSHFYAEVLRVKMIAAEVSRSGNLLIIFDELFKGTNVKDAYDATLAVTSALTRHRQCVFMISTHITEVGTALKTELDNQVQFVFLPTVMNGHVPTYPRKLAAGISADRHGMMIIENEGILDIIRPVAQV
jgi:DNA mismatch repair ATPase MutS